MDGKLQAATQVVGEARHVEVFYRYIDRDSRSSGLLAQGYDRGHTARFDRLLLSDWRASPGAAPREQPGGLLRRSIA